MKLQILGAVIGALLAVPSGAQAQNPSRSPSVSDPNAAVPPLAYQSAVAQYTRATEANSPTPDKSWRNANDAVAGSSAGHQHEAKTTHGAGHGPTSPDATPQPRAPATPSSADHGKHH